MLQPDYSVSFNNVLRRVVQREVYVAQTLNVLRYCQRRSKPALSSWTPDWSKAAEEAIIPNMTTAIHVKPDVQFSDDLQSLQVKAVLWDVIDIILDLPTKSDKDDSYYSIEFLIAVHESRQFVRQMSNSNPYGSENERVEAFWQTLFGKFTSIEELTGDCLGYRGSVSWLEWLPPLPSHWSPRYKCTQDVEKNPDHEAWVSRGVDLPNNPFGIMVPDPFHHLRTEGILAATDTKKPVGMVASNMAASPRFRHLIGRKLFVTQKGYIGPGPPDCAKRDAVVVILGAEVPFILMSVGSC